MCMICVIRRAATPVAMTAANAIHAIADSHRTILAQQFDNSPMAAQALFGEIGAEGADVEMVLTGDAVSGRQVLTACVVDGEQGLRITYEHLDMNAKVTYTGDGPENQSTIGVDAIDSALEYIASREGSFAALRALGVGKAHGFADSTMETEENMLGLVKRCLIALREHAK